MPRARSIKTQNAPARTMLDSMKRLARSDGRALEIDPVTVPSTDGGQVPSGFASVANVPWGTHLCQFYRTTDELAATVVPYFAAGLAHNERCRWIACEELGASAAWDALRAAVPDAERHVREGSLEILDHDDWDTRTGRLGSAEVLKGWLDDEQQALRDGFSGLRITGNTPPLGRTDWVSLREYEARLHEAVQSRRIVALCSYALDRCSSVEMLDVVRNHAFALVHGGGSWEPIDSATEVLFAVGRLPAAEPSAGAGSLPGPQGSQTRIPAFPPKEGERC